MEEYEEACLRHNETYWRSALEMTAPTRPYLLTDKNDYDEAVQKYETALSEYEPYKRAWHS